MGRPQICGALLEGVTFDGFYFIFYKLKHSAKAYGKAIFAKPIKK